MSWYSDGEPFDEYEPSYCERCTRETTFEMCRKCRKERDIEENEDYYREEW